MSKKNNKFKFLKESPIKSVKDDKFGHSKIADTLESILKNETCPHTIGLFSDWGTGKSGVIKLLKLKESKEFKVIEFDCWKYQEDTFRRQLILQVAEDLELGKKKIKALENAFIKNTSETKSKTEIDWLKLILTGGFLMAITFLITFIDNFSGWTNAELQKSLVETFTNWGIWVKNIALSLSIPAFSFAVFREVFQIKKVTISENRLDLPEQFERKFVEVIQGAKNSKDIKNLVVVVDNLDRIETEKTRNVLATLKTFLEIDKKKHKLDIVVTFLVPCDYEAIKKTAPETILAEEFLKKIFNIHLWIPRFIQEDLELETSDLLKETNLPELIDNESIEDVINAAFKDNPRQIKQFINNLAATLLFAKNTEVKEEIELNTAFLAKTLIIKQISLEAYKALRIYWFDVDQIVSYLEELNHDRKQKDVEPLVDNLCLKELSTFLANTDNIKTNDAKPFIDFKKSHNFSSLEKSKNLLEAFLNDSHSDAEKIIHSYAGSNNEHACIKFILSTLRDYETQNDLFFSIFKTQIEALSTSKFTLDKELYFKRVCKYFQAQLGEKYLEIEPNFIFSLLVEKNKFPKYRNIVLNKYLNAFQLSDGEEAKEAKLEMGQKLLNNFLENFEILTKTQKDLLNQHLLKYSSNTELMGTLVTQDEKTRKRLISKESLSSFTKQVFRKEFFTTSYENLLAFKPLIDEYKMHDLLWDHFSNFLVQLNSEADLVPCLPSIDLFSNLCSNFEFENQKDHQRKIVDSLVQVLQKLESWEQKVRLLNVLFEIYKKEIAELQPLIKPHIESFIGGNAVSSRELIDIMKEWQKDDLKEFYRLFSAIIPRRINANNDLEFLCFIYPCVGDNEKLEIIDSMIANQSNAGVTFINDLDEKKLLKNKNEVLIKLFTRFDTHSEKAVFDYIFENLNKSTPPETKDRAKDTLVRIFKQNQFPNELFSIISEDKFLTKPQKETFVSEIFKHWTAVEGQNIPIPLNNTVKIIVELFEYLDFDSQDAFEEKLFIILDSAHIPDVKIINLVLSKKLNTKNFKKRYKAWLDSFPTKQNEYLSPIVTFVENFQPHTTESKRLLKVAKASIEQEE